jgi:hypothetical protein
VQVACSFRVPCDNQPASPMGGVSPVQPVQRVVYLGGWLGMGCGRWLLSRVQALQPHVAGCPLGYVLHCLTQMAGALLQVTGGLVCAAAMLWVKVLLSGTAQSLPPAGSAVASCCQLQPKQEGIKQLVWSPAAVTARPDTVGLVYLE